jgi:hypothetical protein
VHSVFLRLPYQAQVYCARVILEYSGVDIPILYSSLYIVLKLEEKIISSKFIAVLMKVCIFKL